MADALANLATTIALCEGETTNIPVCNRWVLPSLDTSDHEDSNAITIATNNEEDWKTPLIEYLKHGKLPDDTRYKTEVRRSSTQGSEKKTVVDFILVNIIFRYGIPWYIITDNGRPFYNKSMDKLYFQFGFKQHNSSMYNAAANGLAEAFNKTLCNLLKKVVSKSKRDWHEKIGEALWAYQTTHRTATQATPYSLVYGVEAVLPLESQIPSLCIAIQEGLTVEDNARLRAFNKKVRPRSFQVGDLVLAVRRPITLTQRMGNKFVLKWDGPYVVKEAYTNGAYKLIDKDDLLIGPINGKLLKRYYP
ncbi:UNVERIFIED_CONTAM: hypothetical protein Slati_1352700 [Sesamum latifolium]|uniref:Integrase catalytic domain-containing protein n=1 Tax=Sesamum latifolium TaxID=2727402 RepID=A0AAW2XNG0_9LAMI